MGHASGLGGQNLSATPGWCLVSAVLPTNKGMSGTPGTGSTPGTWSKAHAQVVTPAEACDKNLFLSITGACPQPQFISTAQPSQ